MFVVEAHHDFFDRRMYHPFYSYPLSIVVHRYFVQSPCIFFVIAMFECTVSEILSDSVERTDPYDSNHHYSPLTIVFEMCHYTFQYI